MPLPGLDHGTNHDISIADGRVVALQLQRSWNRFIRLQGTVGTAGKRMIVDHFFPVKNYRYMTVDQGNVVRLPRVADFAGVLSRIDPIEDGADSVNSLHSTVTVHDLDFTHLFPFGQGSRGKPRRPTMLDKVIGVRVFFDPFVHGGSGTRRRKGVFCPKMGGHSLIMNNVLAPPFQLGQLTGFDFCVGGIVRDVVDFVRITIARDADVRQCSFDETPSSWQNATSSKRAK